MARFWIAHEFEGTIDEAQEAARIAATDDTRAFALVADEAGKPADASGGKYVRVSEVYGGR